jgi:hypothetical protein
MDQLNTTSRRFLLWLYLLNASVLITHEIDSAYWQEWELFGLPGGIQLFLVLNFLVVLLILFGQQALAQGKAAGIVMSWVLVAGGLFAAGIHAYFILAGDLTFRQPVSISLLGATFVLSLLQGAGLVDASRKTR